MTTHHIDTSSSEAMMEYLREKGVDFSVRSQPNHAWAFELEGRHFTSSNLQQGCMYMLQQVMQNEGVQRAKYHL